VCCASLARAHVFFLCVCTCVAFARGLVSLFLSDLFYIVVIVVAVSDCGERLCFFPRRRPLARRGFGRASERAQGQRGACFPLSRTVFFCAGACVVGAPRARATGMLSAVCPSPYRSRLPPLLCLYMRLGACVSRCAHALHLGNVAFAACFLPVFVSALRGGEKKGQGKHATDRRGSHITDHPKQWDRAFDCTRICGGRSAPV
jgi:hypothetical protein